MQQRANEIGENWVCQAMERWVITKHELHLSGHIDITLWRFFDMQRNIFLTIIDNNNHTIYMNIYQPLDKIDHTPKISKHYTNEAKIVYHPKHLPRRPCSLPNMRVPFDPCYFNDLFAFWSQWINSDRFVSFNAYYRHVSVKKSLQKDFEIIGEQRFSYSRIISIVFWLVFSLKIINTNMVCAVLFQVVIFPRWIQYERKQLIFKMARSRLLCHYQRSPCGIRVSSI